MPPKARKTSKKDAPSSSKASSSSRRHTRARSPTPPPAPPPAPLPWPLATSEQHRQYAILKKRRVISSKFFDAFTMNHLGISAAVTALLEIIGWSRFATFQFHTYEEITYEFLSTLRANIYDLDGDDTPTIFFRCMGVDRALTLGQFNAIFGFPNDGIHEPDHSYSPNSAWTELTGLPEESYRPSRSKSTALPNHALRYIHRVMAHSIFGRGLSHGVVNKVELFFLWAMVNAVPVNTGVWLISHLLHVSRQPDGAIAVGGIVSIIAHAFGFVPLPIFQVADDPHLVDIEHLTRMRVCRSIGQGQYRLLDDAGNVMEPGEEEEPLPEEDDVADYMQPPHMEEPPQEPQPDPVPPPPPASDTQHIIERLDRMEETQRQMLEMLQRMEAWMTGDK